MPSPWCLLPALLLCACGDRVVGVHDGDEPGDVPRVGEGDSAVMVQLFEWPYADVAEECERYLGPNGFGYVQVSPAHEHSVLAARPWWQRYQPVSYLWSSRGGDEAALRDMVARCERAGVTVVLEFVVNNMAGADTGVGSGGTAFGKYDYPGVYTTSDFHAPCAIVQSDYANDASRVWNCELEGNADLDTSRANVRARLSDALAELYALGVRGFHLIAAKHVSPTDLEAVLEDFRASISGTPFVSLEVVDYDATEAVKVNDYLTIGGALSARVSEFKYAIVGDKFLNKNGQKLRDLNGLGEDTWKLVPSGRGLAFFEDPGTVRRQGIHYGDGVLQDLAHVYLLSFPYGLPRIMSGYAFDRNTQEGRDAGPVSDASGRTLPVYEAGAPRCAVDRATAMPGEFVCEHRAAWLAPLIAFRAHAAGSPVTRLWDNGENQLAFAREGKGFVVINRQDAMLDQTLDTGLAAGTYCNVLVEACTEPVTVDRDGRARVVVPAMSAVVLSSAVRP